MSTPKAAAIYCRISRDQAGEGLGVARQEELCRKLAADKGWPIADVYVDNDLSAYSGAPRPAYDRMLEDLEAGTIDAVVVVDQDRLTRHPMELEGFIGLADRLGVPLANVSGDIDLSTSDGRFRARIMGAVARQESEKKSERLRRQREQHAARGKFHGGIRRFGYRPKDGTLEIVTEEAALVREAAERFLTGESLRRIAEDWNGRGVKTVSGSTWRVTSMRTMLAGPHITGLRVHRGEIVGEADWPAILDRTTWERIRAKVGDPRRVQGGRPPAYLLTAFLKCWACGGSLTHSWRADNREGRYACAPSAGVPRCGKVAIAADPVESVVTEAVLDALAVPELFAAVEGHDVDTEALTRQIEDTEDRLDTLARHYAEGRISDREWFTARATLVDRHDELRGQYPTNGMRRSAHRDLPADAGGLRELWEAATLDEQRSIIGLVVDRIVVGPGILDGKRQTEADRLEIHWNTG